MKADTSNNQTDAWHKVTEIVGDGQYLLMSKLQWVFIVRGVLTMSLYWPFYKHIGVIVFTATRGKYRLLSRHPMQKNLNYIFHRH